MFKPKEIYQMQKDIEELKKNGGGSGGGVSKDWGEIPYIIDESIESLPGKFTGTHLASTTCLAGSSMYIFGPNWSKIPGVTYPVDNFIKVNINTMEIEKLTPIANNQINNSFSPIIEVDGYIYLFGVQNADGSGGEIFKYSIADNIWSDALATKNMFETIESSIMLSNSTIYLTGHNGIVEFHINDETITYHNYPNDTLALRAGGGLIGDYIYIKFEREKEVGASSWSESSKCYKFNILTKEFTVIVSPQERRFGCTAATSYESIVFLGGKSDYSSSDKTHHTDDIFIYNTKTDTWSKSNVKLAFKARVSPACVFNNDIYISPGEYSGYEGGPNCIQKYNARYEQLTPPIEVSMTTGTTDTISTYKGVEAQIVYNKETGGLSAMDGITDGGQRLLGENKDGIVDLGYTDVKVEGTNNVITTSASLKANGAMAMSGMIQCIEGNTFVAIDTDGSIADSYTAPPSTLNINNDGCMCVNGNELFVFCGTSKEVYKYTGGNAGTWSKVIEAATFPSGITLGRPMCDGKAGIIYIVTTNCSVLIYNIALNTFDVIPTPINETDVIDGVCGIVDDNLYITLSEIKTSSGSCTYGRGFKLNLKTKKFSPIAKNPSGLIKSFGGVTGESLAVLGGTDEVDKVPEIISLTELEVKAVYWCGRANSSGKLSFKELELKDGSTERRCKNATVGKGTSISYASEVDDNNTSSSNYAIVSGSSGQMLAGRSELITPGRLTSIRAIFGSGSNRVSDAYIYIETTGGSFYEVGYFETTTVNWKDFPLGTISLVEYNKSDAVWQYKPKEDTWTKSPTKLPIPDMLATATSYADMIYYHKGPFTGGDSVIRELKLQPDVTSDSVALSIKKSSSDSLQIEGVKGELIYNTDTNKVHSMSGVTPGGKVLAIDDGGTLINIPASVVLDRSVTFAGYSSCGVLASDGHFYVMGCDPTQGYDVPSLYKYDTDKKTISQFMDSSWLDNKTFQFIQPASLGDYIYFCEGSETVDGVVENYGRKVNIKTKVASSFGASNIPFAHSLHVRSVVYGESIYFIPSELGIKFYKYTPLTDIWDDTLSVNDADELDALINGDIAILGDDIYIVGGSGQGANGYVRPALRYNITTNTWHKIASLGYEVWQHHVTIACGNVVALLGNEFISDTGYTSKVSIYNKELDSWSHADLPDITTKHTQPLGYVKDDIINCFSGSSSTTRAHIKIELGQKQIDDIDPLALMRGTTKTLSGYTGRCGEIAYNTDTKEVVTFDGTTVGGSLGGDDTIIFEPSYIPPREVNIVGAFRTSTVAALSAPNDFGAIGEYIYSLGFNGHFYKWHKDIEPGSGAVENIAGDWISGTTCFCEWEQVFYKLSSDLTSVYKIGVDAVYEHVVDTTLTIPKIGQTRQITITRNGLFIISDRGFYTVDLSTGVHKKAIFTPPYSDHGVHPVSYLEYSDILDKVYLIVNVDSSLGYERKYSHELLVYDHKANKVEIETVLRVGVYRAFTACIHGTKLYILNGTLEISWSRFTGMLVYDLNSQTRDEYINSHLSSSNIIPNIGSGRARIIDGSLWVYAGTMYVCRNLFTIAGETKNRVAIPAGGDLEVNAYGGIEGEIIYNKDTKAIHVYDGASTPGTVIDCNKAYVKSNYSDRGSTRSFHNYEDELLHHPIYGRLPKSFRGHKFETWALVKFVFSDDFEEVVFIQTDLSVYPLYFSSMSYLSSLGPKFHGTVYNGFGWSDFMYSSDFFGESHLEVRYLRLPTEEIPIIRAELIDSYGVDHIMVNLNLDTISANTIDISTERNIVLKGNCYKELSHPKLKPRRVDDEIIDIENGEMVIDVSKRNIIIGSSNNNITVPSVDNVYTKDTAKEHLVSINQGTIGDISDNFTNVCTRVDNVKRAKYTDVFKKYVVFVDSKINYKDITTSSGTWQSTDVPLGGTHAKCVWGIFGNKIVCTDITLANEHVNSPIRTLVNTITTIVINDDMSIASTSSFTIPKEAPFSGMCHSFARIGKYLVLIKNDDMMLIDIETGTTTMKNGPTKGFAKVGRNIVLTSHIAISDTEFLSVGICSKGLDEIDIDIEASNRVFRTNIVTGVTVETESLDNSYESSALINRRGRILLAVGMVSVNHNYTDATKVIQTPTMQNKIYEFNTESNTWTYTGVELTEKFDTWSTRSNQELFMVYSSDTDSGYISGMDYHYRGDNMERAIYSPDIYVDFTPVPVAHKDTSILKGTTDEISTYLGTSGQLIADTTLNKLHLMDGVVPGGHIVSGSGGDGPLPSEIATKDELATAITGANTYADAKVASIVDSSPDTLNTLNELAAALGDDPNFATTMTTLIGTKVTKVDGKVLSSNDYTTVEKTKLASLSNADLTGLATETYVDNAVSKIIVPDITGLATKVELSTGLTSKADNIHTHDNYSLKEDVYTKTQTDTLISNVTVDLSDYYTKSQITGLLNSKADVSSIMTPVKYTITSSDWILKSDGLYEHSLIHGGDIPIEEVDIKFYSHGENQLMSYLFVNNTTIKIISDAADEVIIAIKKLPSQSSSILRRLDALEEENRNLRKIILKLT